MIVLQWDGDFPQADYYGHPKWNKKSPVIPYRRQSDGSILFDTYAAYGKYGWAEVEQNFTATMKVLHTTTGRSAANMILVEPATGFKFVSTQNDLDYLLQNRVLDHGLMDRPVTWQWNKRGSNYLLNIKDRLDVQNAS